MEIFKKFTHIISAILICRSIKHKHIIWRYDGCHVFHITNHLNSMIWWKNMISHIFHVQINWRRITFSFQRNNVHWVSGYIRRYILSVCKANFMTENTNYSPTSALHTLPFCDYLWINGNSLCISTDRDIRM